MKRKDLVPPPTDTKPTDVKTTTEVSGKDVAEIEKQRQDEIQSGNTNARLIHDTESAQPLTGADENMANKMIEKTISKAKNTDDVHSFMTQLGWNLRGKNIDDFNQFVQDRIDGKTDKTFEEWRNENSDRINKINEKYDKQLADLEKQQSGKDVVVDEGVGKDNGIEVYSEPKRYNSEIKVGQKYYDNRYGDFYTIEKMTQVEGGDVDATLKYDKGKTRTESGNFLLYHIDAKQHSLSKEQPIVSQTQKQEKTDDYYIYDFENKEFVKTDNAKPVKLDTDGDFFAVKGDNGYYTIYEGTSGQGIGQSGKLLRDAIKNANESIERNSKAGFPLEMAISGGIKRNGQSPRVKAKNENKSNNEIGKVGSKETQTTETPKPQQQSLSTKPEIKNEEAKAIDTEITKLEQERDVKLKSEGKPLPKLEFLSSKELVDSKDPIGNKKIHNELKDKYKRLRELIDCIWL